MPQNILQRSCLPPPGYHGVQHLISQQATQTPGMLAVVCGKQYMTYAQLERQANQLAHALLRREIGPGICVGLCFSHSIDLLVALLAILKAGGCFLLLETISPLSHMLLQLNQWNVPLLLTHQRISKRLVDYQGDILCLDRDQFLWVGESSSTPLVSSSGEQLASILYTSSNQGYAQLNQRDLLTICLNQLEDLAFVPSGQSTISLSQVSNLELLFSPLLTGGSLQILLAENCKYGDELA